MYHDKACHANAIEIPDKAEEKRGKQAVNCVGAQIFRGSIQNRRILRENGSGEDSMEIVEIKHDNAECKGKRDCAAQCLPAPIIFLSSVILGDDRGQRLHKRGRNQHNKSADLFRYADARRSDKPEGVDDGENYKEGDADQKIRKPKRKAQGEDSPHDGRVRAYHGARKQEGKRLTPDDTDGYQNADRLGENGGYGGAGGTHMEYRDVQKIARYIESAGNGNGNQRRFGVPDAAENRP